MGSSPPLRVFKAYLDISLVVCSGCSPPLTLGPPPAGCVALTTLTTGPNIVLEMKKKMVKVKVGSERNVTIILPTHTQHSFGRV